MYARDDKKINNLIETLKQEDTLIRWEGLAEGFLGVNMINVICGLKWSHGLKWSQGHQCI
jgi:hypothetical protein